MQQNKILSFIIPIVAVIIIFESVMLVSNLTSKKTITVAPLGNVVTVTPVPEANVFDFIFTTASKEMKVGKSYKVDLSVVAKKDVSIDGAETYIKYDPTLMTISGLVSSTKLPKPIVSKIDAANGLIQNIFIVETKENYKMVKDVITPVISFNVTPKKVGLMQLEISTGNADKKFVTMIVETATSKSLAFSASKLEINATK